MAGRPAYPDEFYKSVVDAQLTGMTQKEIASEYGVLTSTVTRWIRVARDRGLAPASRGIGSAVWSQHCPCCGASKSGWKHDLIQKEVK